jgi:Spy/CpxP family protein refolding chaperone
MNIRPTLSKTAAIIGLLAMTGSAAFAQGFDRPGSVNPFGADRQISTHQGQHKHHRHNMLARMKKQLNLSQDQVNQLKPILAAQRDARKQQHEAFAQQFRGILTPEQQAKLDQMKAQREAYRQNKDWEGARKSHHNGFASLNLTDAQKAQVKQIREQMRPQMQANREQFRSQVEGVLNADQKAKFEQMLAQRQQQHGRHHRGGGEQPSAQ